MILASASAGKGPSAGISTSSAPSTGAAAAASAEKPMVICRDVKALRKLSDSFRNTLSSDSLSRFVPILHQPRNHTRSRIFPIQSICELLPVTNISHKTTRIPPDTHLELWYDFLISSDSSMIESYSDCREVRRAGMEVWLACRGGSVEGSTYQAVSTSDAKNLVAHIHSLALTSIKSSFVRASPETGSVPFSSTSPSANWT